MARLADAHDAHFPPVTSIHSKGEGQRTRLGSGGADVDRTALDIVGNVLCND